MPKPTNTLWIHSWIAPKPTHPTQLCEDLIWIGVKGLKNNKNTNRIFFEKKLSILNCSLKYLFKATGTLNGSLLTTPKFYRSRGIIPKFKTGIIPGENRPGVFLGENPMAIYRQHCPWGVWVLGVQKPEHIEFFFIKNSTV